MAGLYSDGTHSYTLDLQNTLPVAQFMADIGTIKHRPQAWTDYMLPSATGRKASPTSIAS